MARQRSAFDVIGVDKTEQLLTEFSFMEAERISNLVLRKLAQEALDLMQILVPVDEGTLKKSLRIRRRTDKLKNVSFAVIAQSGKRAKFDGFYWYMVEHGTQGPIDQTAQPFAGPAVQYVQKNMPGIIDRNFKTPYERAVRKKQRQIRRQNQAAARSQSNGD